MLVKYIRDGQKLIGCVVATGPSQIGVSILNPKDTFSKERAKTIAVGRSLTGSICHVPKRKVDVCGFDFSLDAVVSGEVLVMQERSLRYFK